MKKILMLAVITLILVGCKIKVETIVNSDDLLLEVHKESWAEIDVEVASCSDFNDSRKASRSLIEAVEIIDSTFQNARYLECYKQQFNSYAKFAIPMSVGHMGHDGAIQTYEMADIYVVSNDIIYLGIVVAPEALERIQRTQKRTYQTFDLNFSITLIKGEKTIPELFIIGAYISNDQLSNEPIAISKVNIASERLTIKLSDVTNAIISEGGVGPVLFTQEAIEGMLKNQ